MNKHVQIRNLPASLHKKLKLRAVKHDTTISGYLKGLIERDLAKPTMKEWLDKARSRPPLTKISSEEILQTIQEAREERDARIDRIVEGIGKRRKRA